jgi:LmbE family N-acetylglucosaminyl deacetylase
MIGNIINNNRVLVLGAHPDDELGCGATISKMISEGVTVYHYYFSLCEQSLVNIGLDTNQLQNECNESRKVLGILQENCGNFNYPVRYFPSNRQDILEDLIQLRKKIDPCLVFVPNSNDIHQDHHCLYEEALRTFKNVTVLGYELPWNTMTMSHDCLINVEEEFLKSKIEAVKCYKSQMHRNYSNIEFYESLAKVRGVQANTKYAECFEVIRLLL